MDEATLTKLLEKVSSGQSTVEEAVSRLKRLPFADLGFAKVDHHRPLRQGFAEAVYGPGKTPEQCAAIVKELISSSEGRAVILTRATQEQVQAATASNPNGTITLSVPEDPTSISTVTWGCSPPRKSRVAVVTAGTADLPVAREAAATLDALGFTEELVTDVGAAGIHRLVQAMPVLESSQAVIVVAGMEGALATVVAGMVAVPVVAVPTSVGYGAALEGVTALLAMLSSCSPGVCVVGIDNGFGAGCAVARMLP
jgi:NCAIR mutase (PurE)-related protein